MINELLLTNQSTYFFLLICVKGPIHMDKEKKVVE